MVADPGAPASFSLESPFAPQGDQPAAIEALCTGVAAGRAAQTLMGVTGSGKTFTMANVIARLGRPTLVLAHNKTLAAQLYGELKQLFPRNAVSYFVSYYDYYQPEAYVPSTDTFIEKDSRTNEEIERMRHAATQNLLERRDVIVVASVSCIYGLGSPDSYRAQQLRVRVGDTLNREAAMARLVEIQYTRGELDFHRGTFRARGDVLEVYPPHLEDRAVRVSLFGDEVEAIELFDPLRGRRLSALDDVTVYPASHYVAPADTLIAAVAEIERELDARLEELMGGGRLLEAQRLQQRTEHDLELLREVGFCKGIENYSRHLTGAAPGEPPPCLLSYFSGDWLLLVDESHVSLPQVRGMYQGDRARKETLVAHGFRLPSALDNRPLRFDEFLARSPQTIYISATPGEFEVARSEGVVVEQLIRPTGLLDPPVEVRPALHQVDDLLVEVRAVAARGQRALVTTLTKRMAEELTEYFQEVGVRVRYLHSDVETLERSALLRDLRRGEFDVLVGINLLREGLDLPEVALVAILDADKEGFLRNRTSLIQTIGRAARNVEGRVLMYADRVTESMRAALDETERRRALQHAYNEAHGVVPTSTVRGLEDLNDDVARAREAWGGGTAAERRAAEVVAEAESLRDVYAEIDRLRQAMAREAEALRFEEAARLRDELRALEALALREG
ncbi:MAG: excinuclease ABC subunit UvrB [Deltaproteobacteria bacterium]|nr:excinuclease ABC subunit UvrB [Deltaproteobacteria bacterium]